MIESLCIQSKYRKMWTRITPNTDTFHAVTFARKEPQQQKVLHILILEVTISMKYLLTHSKGKIKSV